MSCSTSGLPVHHQLLESTQTHVHRVGDATQPFHPLFPLLLLPSIFPNIRVFSNESALCIRWPNICSFSFSICPSNKHPKLISFRMGWLDLLAVQGALKSLLQHHSSKASMFLCVAFFIVQLSHHVLNVCILVSFEMDLCVWGGLSVFWWSVVPFYCEGFSQWVGLDVWLVEVCWLGKLVSVFWWVELDFFSLECNGVSSSEF